MNILAIETTSPAASVALIDGEGRLAEVRSDAQFSHLQNLMPMIDRLLKKCQLQLSDINAVAVSEGPGSFTGIRIGMAAAKGLAQVLDVGVIPVPTLRAMACGMSGHEGLVCPMLDARRGQVYGGAYIWRTAEDGRRCCEEAVPGGAYLETALRALATEASMRLGLDPAAMIFLGPEHQQAANIARLALEDTGAARSVFEVRPVYMRLAEAERRLAEKKG